MRNGVCLKPSRGSSHVFTIMIILFKISGVVRTASILDREERSSHWVVIEAEDTALVPKKAAAHLFVRVLDRYDGLMV